MKFEPGKIYFDKSKGIEVELIEVLSSTGDYPELCSVKKTYPRNGAILMYGVSPADLVEVNSVRSDLANQEQTVFVFKHEDGDSIVKPDADGRYRDGFYGSEQPEGISEADALHQWLLGELACFNIRHELDHERYMDFMDKLCRLSLLAEPKTEVRS